MKKCFREMVISSLFLVSGVRAESSREIYVAREEISLHDNQIFIKCNGSWRSVGGLSTDGNGLYISSDTSSLKPLMSRCSRFELEWDYKEGKLKVIGHLDPEDRKNEAQSASNSEYDNKPDSWDCAERDYQDKK